MNWFNQIVNRGVRAAAGVFSHGRGGMGLQLSTHYHVECRDKNGKLKWTDSFNNLVVITGLNDSLDKHLKGSSYTAAWFVGLTGNTPVFDEDDDMTTHAGWTEVVAYDEGDRPALVLGDVAAGSVDNSLSKAEFTISTNSTGVGGLFVTSDDAKSGTDGVLYGGGAFTGGNKTLSDGDTLDVTVTCTAAAAA